MYLGCERDDFPGYMMRDGIVFEIDKYLVEEKKININAKDEDNCTVLFAACKNGYFDVVKYPYKNTIFAKIFTL